MTSSFSLSSRFLFLASIMASLVACQHQPIVRVPEVAVAPRVYEGKAINALPCRWMDADSRLAKKVTVIFVPGSGNQNFSGTQTGNGFVSYAKALELGTAWQTRLAQAGYDVLAYDKRAGTSGPSALSEDVDAACDEVKRRFGNARPIVLWSSEQGTQVVLSSKCLSKSKALVLVSPIPGALDKVWIAGLKEKGFRDRALSLTATFESIRKGLFEPNSKIMGASLQFWKNWLSAAEKTPNQLEVLTVPAVFAMGEDDVWLGTLGRQLLENVVKKRPDRKLVVISKADRNLLQKEVLSSETMETMVRALENLGKLNGQ